MKIRTRLAVRFTIIVASLLVLFASAIYYFSSSYREKEFYSRLNEKALNYATLAGNVEEVTPNLVRIFDRNTAYLPNEKILIYNSGNEQIFNTNNDTSKLSENFLANVIAKKEIRYMQQNKNEVLAIFHPNRNSPLIVFVSAFDEDGFNKLNNLQIIMSIGLLVCVMATMLAGWVYSGQALRPISDVIGQVEKTSANNLTVKIDEGNGKDEIAQLAITFNRMLKRIQNSFELQKSFVANSSHELRTPLTSITGQLEVALMSERKSEEYRVVLHSILEDIKNVNRLTNSLLDLAQADMDLSRLKMKPVRIDELLWQTRNELLKRNPGYTLLLEVKDFPEEEGRLLVYGSEHLLRSALLNIMDNACKFSPDKTTRILFSFQKEYLSISFTDKGIGISREDLKKITEPFYRGGNAKSFPGHGLGLSLTAKIIALHKGEMNLRSELNEYTEVEIRLKLIDGGGVSHPVF